ncbi:S41 family peptidase [Anaerosporobacter faecicola]|uniref:S41 family peptidase n=1 Tax=Anaerosporobacter faecicola TaxID=2718714 RepID=UPI00143C9623|nr:S41 family peptidase [Anaerosporobacter faecicola]
MKNKVKLLAINIRLFITKRKILCTVILCIVLVVCGFCTFLAMRKQRFGLSKQQMMEDYEAVEQMLKENYPYWRLLERNNQSIDKAFETRYEKMQECDGDSNYYNIFFNTFNQLSNMGGLNICDYWRYCYTQDIRQRFAEEQNQYALSVLQSKESKKAYKILKYIHNTRDYLSEFRDRKVKTVLPDNIETQIVKEDEIAYLGIKTFDFAYVKEDKEEIMSFLENIKSYKHLIIDVRSVYSGVADFYKENLVAPNIGEALTAEQYLLFKGGDNNQVFLQSLYKSDEIKNIDTLPDYPQISEEDLEEMDLYVQDAITVEPIGTPIFQGKIWLLTDQYTYGAADQFAYFCKKTGFATVVGETTAGGGLGIDTFLYQIPNSHLFIEYHGDYPINEDGSCNYIQGTTPDYLTSNENIEEECMKRIENGEN